ncbi:MAG TPA: TrkA family potassium uptake protein [Thermoleophilaceae bacterium]|nr:TrkA family potassium uptake protein [Thermoleophilaceae bacterium]
MRILVCGGGSTGLHVARVLGEVHDVTVIERSPERVPDDPAGLRFVVGDAADPDVLLKAGGREADALVAVTRDDPVNLVIAQLAKRALGIRWTVARMKDPEHEWLFTPDAGVDVVVSTAALVARLVQEEVTAGDLVTLLRLRGAGIAVTETTLPPGAAVAGLRASDLTLPEGIAITAIVRGGHVLLPERAGRLVAGDVVVALCEPGREHVLHSLLTGEVGPQ